MGAVLKNQQLDERMRELFSLTFHDDPRRFQKRPGARRDRPAERRKRYLLETGRIAQYVREFGALSKGAA